MTNQDLSRIDFSKCDLPKVCGVAAHAKVDGASISMTLNGFGSAAVKTKGLWRYSAMATWGWLSEAKVATDAIDFFITSELARLAAEDEAANWVEVPWKLSPAANCPGLPVNDERNEG